MIDPETNSSNEGSECEICKRLIKDHLPEEFAECQRKINAKKITEGDGR